MRTSHLTLFAAAFVLAATSCLAPRHVAAPSSAAIAIDVPTVSQEKADECGLASLAMLCVHYEVDVPTEIRERLSALAADGRGLSGAEIRDALQACGLETHLFEGNLDDSAASLYRHLDRSRPVLVQVGGEGDELMHAVLVTGYDPVEDMVLLLDPQHGPRWMPIERFEAAWTEANRFALVAVPPENLGDEERASLRKLTLASSETLEQQVAGDSSRDGLTTVFLVLGIIVLVVILL